MAFQKPQINKISTDIKDLTFYIRTIKKFGKSTLFRDTILAKYGDPEKGLLVSIGREIGDKLLDNLNKTHANTYKDFLELKDWLIKTKGKEHDIQIIAFDTVDELVPIFEKEVVRLDNIENPNKKAKSIKGAFGGYTAGEQMAAAMIKDYIGELTDVGFGVWAIAHTKFKNIKQKGDLTEGYMNLSSTLANNYEAAFGDIFDVTLTGMIDRSLEEEVKEVNGKEKTTRYATDSIRKLYFRGTSLIDAGGRFADGAVPEFLIFDKPNMGEIFIQTVEKGMELSKTTSVKKQKSVKVAVVEEKKAVEESFIEELDNSIEDEKEELDEVNDSVDKDTLVDEIRAKFKACKDKEIKSAVKVILSTEGDGTLSNKLELDALQEILAKLS